MGVGRSDWRNRTRRKTKRSGGSWTRTRSRHRGATKKKLVGRSREGERIFTSRSGGGWLLCECEWGCECECEWPCECPCPCPFVCACAAYALGPPIGRAGAGSPAPAPGAGADTGARTSCVAVVGDSWACTGVGVVVCADVGGAGCSWGGGVAASAESRSMLDPQVSGYV